jgi:dephospho-CoA kinase
VLRARAADVEHIGSTSVPGLLAKDVVDVQVGVAELTAADDPGFVAAMRDGGYLLVEGNDHDHPHPKGADLPEWSTRFYGGCDPGCVVNVHVRQTSPRNDPDQSARLTP